MAAMQAAPLFLSFLVGLLLGLMAWGLMRCCVQEAGPSLMDGHDRMLLGLLVLATFALGVFLAYVVLR